MVTKVKRNNLGRVKITAVVTTMMEEWAGQ